MHLMQAGDSLTDVMRVSVLCVVRWSSCLSGCLILGRLEGSYTIHVQIRGAGYPVRSVAFLRIPSWFLPTPSLLPSLSPCVPPSSPLSPSLRPFLPLFSSLPLIFLLLSPSLLFSQLLNISFVCIHAHTWEDHCDIDMTGVLVMSEYSMAHLGVHPRHRKWYKIQ